MSQRQLIDLRSRLQRKDRGPDKPVDDVHGARVGLVAKTPVVGEQRCAHGEGLLARLRPCLGSVRPPVSTSAANRSSEACKLAD